MKRLLFLAPIFFLAACAQPEPAKPAVDPAKEAADIRATDDQWLAAVKARDAIKTASFWADDAQFAVPGSGLITGRANLNKFAEDAFKDKNFNITWTLDKLEVAASGDLAYETATETVTSTQGKKVVTSQGHGVVVWKKQADGNWKAIVDQSTELPPPASAKSTPT